MDTHLSKPQENYLQSYLNTVVGYYLPITSFDKAIQIKIFDFLTRKEELLNRHRDQWGNWEGNYSDSFLDVKPASPWIDEIIHHISKEYCAANQIHDILPKYPDQKPFALCITHDVDNINYKPSITILSRAIRRFGRCKSTKFEALQLTILKTIKDAYVHKDEYMNRMDFSKFIDLEHKLGFKSTFYCFADELLKPHYYDSYYQYKDKVRYHNQVMSFGQLIREINASGWDIGLHGSYNSALNKQCLAYEKQNLEKHLGDEVVSTRQHWMHFVTDTTPILHDELMFTSDSTLGFNRTIGFRSGVCHPHKLWDTKNDLPYKVWEIPMNLMDGALFYANSLELNEGMAILNCLKVMDRVEQTGGVLTINWHPDHLNKPGFRAVYETLLQEAKHRNAWGCSAAELSKHWEQYQTSVNRIKHG